MIVAIIPNDSYHTIRAFYDEVYHQVHSITRRIKKRTCVRPPYSAFIRAPIPHSSALFRIVRFPIPGRPLPHSHR
ncbi:hypothetical protein [Bacteroides sp. UBA939]|uniref:hypothetical protein n=1 Tax=Bacteroides sp. UBA939 TaxID=1946092 RepID=UPI0025BC8EFA|nr:hypothetical protein [Bacteroides sp. UBA939]